MRKKDERENFMTMLAAMFYAPLDVRLEQRPIPQPGAGETSRSHPEQQFRLRRPECVVDRQSFQGVSGE